MVMVQAGLKRVKLLPMEGDEAADQGEEEVNHGTPGEDVQGPGGGCPPCGPRLAPLFRGPAHPSKRRRVDESIPACRMDRYCTGDGPMEWCAMQPLRDDGDTAVVVVGVDVDTEVDPPAAMPAALVTHALYIVQGTGPGAADRAAGCETDVKADTETGVSLEEDNQDTAYHLEKEEGSPMAPLER